MCLQRELKGHSYYEIEFTASNPKYTRHQLAVVACANGAAGRQPCGGACREAVAVCMCLC